MTSQTQAPSAVVERLAAALNSHDLDALVACFSKDFHSVQPAHPARSFDGADQVRTNWQAIFNGVPDLRASLVRSVASHDCVFAEWEWSGTRRDGAPHEMRGVTVLGISGENIDWANFYMETVDRSDVSVGAAIRDMVGGPR